MKTKETSEVLIQNTPPGMPDSGYCDHGAFDVEISGECQPVINAAKALDEYPTLKAQRDKLLEALKDCESTLSAIVEIIPDTPNGVKCIGGDSLDAARAAIASVEEGEG